VALHIANLPGAELGLAAAGDIWIDESAAGWGWSLGISPTPGRMDLLTVVAHELGHVLGFGHSDGPGVMEATLGPGVRQAPELAPALGNPAGTRSDLPSGLNPALSPLGSLASVTAGGTAAPKADAPLTLSTSLLVSPAVAPLGRAASLPDDSLARVADALFLPPANRVTSLVPAPAATAVPPAPPGIPLGSLLTQLSAAVLEKATSGVAGTSPAPSGSFTALMLPSPSAPLGTAGGAGDGVMLPEEDSWDDEPPPVGVRPAADPAGTPGTAPAAPVAPAAKFSWRAAPAYQAPCDAIFAAEEWAGGATGGTALAPLAREEGAAFGPALASLAGCFALGMVLQAYRDFAPAEEPEKLKAGRLVLRP
jgi:hypothetical protein